MREEDSVLHTLRRELYDLAWLLRLLVVGAVAGAIYRELRLPPDERTWRGKLLGFVPYDFRPPTPRRVLDAYWRPDSERLFGAQPFGVGWALNLPAAGRLLGRLSSRARREDDAG